MLSVVSTAAGGRGRRAGVRASPPAAGGDEGLPHQGAAQVRPLDSPSDLHIGSLKALRFYT